MHGRGINTIAMPDNFHPPEVNDTDVEFNGISSLRTKYSGRRYSIGQNFNPQTYQ